MSRSDPKSNEESSPDADAPGPRVSRHIQPLGPRVLVRVVPSPDRSDAGLYLPEGVRDDKSATLLAEVLEVARTMPKEHALDLDEDDESEASDEPRASLGENVSGIPVGAQVLFDKSRGFPVPWDDSLRVIEVRYILAIVETITQDKLQ